MSDLTLFYGINWHFVGFEIETKTVHYANTGKQLQPSMTA
jgi:hypothetical protein